MVLTHNCEFILPVSTGLSQNLHCNYIATVIFFLLNCIVLPITRKKEILDTNVFALAVILAIITVAAVCRFASINILQDWQQTHYSFALQCYTYEIAGLILHFLQSVNVQPFLSYPEWTFSWACKLILQQCYQLKRFDTKVSPTVTQHI